MNKAVKLLGQPQTAGSGIVRTVTERWQIGALQIEPLLDNRLGEALARLAQLQAEVRMLREVLMRAEHELRREQALLKNARQRELELRAELHDSLEADRQV